MLIAAANVDQLRALIEEPLGFCGRDGWQALYRSLSLAGLVLGL
jgi:hypothetical protein